MNNMHARWITYMQKITFSLKYKSGQINKVVDALSKRATLSVTVAAEVTGFEFLRERYTEDTDFQQVWNLYCEYQDAGDFLIHDRYLFKSDKLCIPQGSLHEKIISELHSGGLGAYLGHDKTIALVVERYY
ncbi:hypothetical protein ACOSQ4_010803 [Xanthoceras sorbifolium]